MRVQRLLMRNPENTAILGRYQGVAPVKWREVLNEDDRRFFHEEAGDMLIELGYVDSDDWVANPG